MNSFRRLMSYILKLFVLDFIYLSDSRLKLDGFVFVIGNSHMGDVFSFYSLLNNFLIKANRSITVISKKEHAFISSMFPKVMGLIEGRDVHFQFSGHVRVVLYNKNRIIFSAFWNLLYMIRLLNLMFLLPILQNKSMYAGDHRTTISYFFYDSIMPFTKFPLEFSKPDLTNIKENEEIEVLISEFGAIPGRTVLIAPESNSGFSLTEAEITSIVNSVTDAGFNYLINATSIDSTYHNAINFPLNILVPLADKLGYFISVRSGLCDLASASKAKPLIIYRKQQLWHYALDKEIWFSSGIVQVIKDMEDPDDELRDSVNGYLIKDI